METEEMESRVRQAKSYQEIIEVQTLVGEAYSHRGLVMDARISQNGISISSFKELNS